MPVDGQTRRPCWQFDIVRVFTQQRGNAHACFRKPFEMAKFALSVYIHQHAYIHEIRTENNLYAPNAAAKRTLRWALWAQRPLVHLPPHQGSKPLSAPLPATRLCANLSFVVLQLSRFNVRATPYSTTDLALATVLPCVARREAGCGAGGVYRREIV